MNIPRIIAHRGASGNAPENTKSAFMMAHEMGARWIETDCMLSMDEQIILHHDNDFMRLANDKRIIATTNLNDIKTIDIGSKFDQGFIGERIMSLDELIIFLQETGMGVNLEIKPTKGMEDKTANIFAEYLNDLTWPENSPAPIISSFSYNALKISKKILPQYEHAILWKNIPVNWQDMMQETNACSLHCDANNLIENMARDIAKLCPLRCYTINNKPTAEKLFNWGVNAIFTDYPERFI